MLKKWNDEKKTSSDYNPIVTGEYSPSKIDLLKKSDWWAYGQVIVYMYSGKKLFEVVTYVIKKCDEPNETDDKTIATIID
jgi:hypothetical protein